MNEEKIILEINSDGSINAKTQGFKGEVCLTQLEEILGEQLHFAQVKKTDEYYQQDQIKTNETVKRSQK